MLARKAKNALKVLTKSIDTFSIKRDYSRCNKLFLFLNNDTKYIFSRLYTHEYFLCECLDLF